MNKIREREREETKTCFFLFFLVTSGLLYTFKKSGGWGMEVMREAWVLRNKEGSQLAFL